MSSILTIVDLYRDRLKVYGHLGLPRFHTSNSFQNRIDMSLITLVRECPNLNTLVNSFHV
jgi:F-box protein 39